LYLKIRIVDLDGIKLPDDDRLVDINKDDLEEEDNLPFFTPELHFAVLESTKSGKIDKENRRRYIHILKFKKQLAEAKVGRGSEADAKVIHSTVSRVHASFKLENDKITVADLGSKFGTVILCTLPFELKPNHENYIQIGRILMNL
jgi:hypothetical protein